METFETLLQEYNNKEIGLYDFIIDSLQFFDNDLELAIATIADELGMSHEELDKWYDNYTD